MGLVLAVPGDVEPVSAPALAVMRRGQQPVDQPRDRPSGESSRMKAAISSGVGGKPTRSKVTRRIRVDLVGRRRRRQAVGSRRARMNRSIGEVGQAASRTAGGSGSPTGLERPERSGLLGGRRRDRGGRLAGGCGSVRGGGIRGEPRARRGPVRASLDPVGQRGDLLVLELALGGHLDVALVADCLDQRALLGLARHDGRPAVAPLEHRRRARRAAGRPWTSARRGTPGSAPPAPAGPSTRRTPPRPGPA